MANTDAAEQREERKVQALESIARSLEIHNGKTNLIQSALQQIANKR